MRVLHVAGTAGRGSYGIGSVVLPLCAALRSQGVAAALFTCDSPTEADELARSFGIPEREYVVFRCIGPRRYAFSPGLLHATQGAHREFDILHHHGVWPCTLYAGKRWAKSSEKPLVITPHGELQEWALSRSQWKKWITSRLYVRDVLERARCFHALGPNEVADIRRCGLGQPIAVIPNGVADDWVAARGTAHAFRSKFGIPEERRLLLFLSRVTPKKGLPLLLGAMAAVRERLDNWFCAIAGPDEFGHLSEVEDSIRQLELSNFVRLIGPLYGQDKRDAMEAAELFILPSHSEGFPIVVVEALGTGLPVICTKGSPVPFVEEYQCGWWPEISVESLSDCLAQAFSLSSEELLAKGQRGRNLVRDRFTWSIIASEFELLYRWLRDGGRKPEFVTRD